VEVPNAFDVAFLDPFWTVCETVSVVYSVTVAVEFEI
jgi:hypothetical protein